MVAQAVVIDDRQQFFWLDEHAPVVQSETLTLPDSLAFAAIPPITIPIMPLTQQVAEKLHAYTRRYGDRTRVNSREKDLIDLVVISIFSPFAARELSTALTRVFATCDTHPPPAAVPPPPAQWGVIYRKPAATVGIDPDLNGGRARVAAFLDPLLSSDPPLDATWDPAPARWLVADDQEVPSCGNIAYVSDPTDFLVDSCEAAQDEEQAGVHQRQVKMRFTRQRSTATILP